MNGIVETCLQVLFGGLLYLKDDFLKSFIFLVIAGCVSDNYSKSFGRGHETQLNMQGVGDGIRWLVVMSRTSVRSAYVSCLHGRGVFVNMEKS